MRIGIVGAGRIGGNCARQFARVGHEVLLSVSRDRARLEALAGEIGEQASVGDAADAVAFGSVVVIAVPWGLIDDVIREMGSLDEKIVVDTTNQFGPGGVVDLGGHTAARHNADRFVGARFTKSFNTLTSGFQGETAGRSGDDRVVQWVAGDDVAAKETVVGLIDDCGWKGVDLADIDGCTVMEAPRRDGAVYGEEYRVPDAAAVVAAVRAGLPIPLAPSYE